MGNAYQEGSGTSASAADRPDAVTETLERLEVADTLEELRHHIDDLLERLVEGDQPGKVTAAATGEVEGQIEALGSKVESASDLLAQLTDLLEAQTERIETIEQQLGDPDPGADVTSRAGRPRGGASRDPEVPTFTMAPRVDPTDALREYLDTRLERLEAGIHEIERRIGEIRGIAELRDRQVRELEDRLLILVDSTAIGPTADGDERASSAPVKRTPRSIDVENDNVSSPDDATDVEPVFRQRPANMPLAAHRSVRGGRRLFRRTIAAAPMAPTHPRPAVAAEPRRQRHDADPPPPNEPSAAELPAPEAFVRVPEGPPAPTAGETRSHAVQELERLVEREVRTLHDFRPGASHSVRPRTGRPAVLVVDDAPEALTVLSIYLSKTGYQVVTASSAEDALAKLRHHEVDAVVLDARMPGADGGHLCRVLREDPAFADKRSIPVIVYTGYPDDFPAETREEWEAADYVVKGAGMLPLITALVRHTNPEANE